MSKIYNAIVEAKKNNTKLLAVLIDPEKTDTESIVNTIQKINQSPATHIFIGGSYVNAKIAIEDIIAIIKNHTKLPVIIFPGHPSQIAKNADGILFLSLISGRNPDFLIEHQVRAAPILKKLAIEIIATGYILVESGNETAVANISKTKPIERNQISQITATAIAGEMLGHKMIYLEAGSGAKLSVPYDVIQKTKENISIPIIVGGGITDLISIKKAYEYGADMVVIGTAFENNANFFNT